MADAEDHMSRVMAQGDLRPMAASREAMEDLKSILASRAAFYSKADMRVDTSAQPLAETSRSCGPRCARRSAFLTGEAADGGLAPELIAHYDA